MQDCEHPALCLQFLLSKRLLSTSKINFGVVGIKIVAGAHSRVHLSEVIRLLRGVSQIKLVPAGCASTNSDLIDWQRLDRFAIVELTSASSVLCRSFFVKRSLSLGHALQCKSKRRDGTLCFYVRIDSDTNSELDVLGVSQPTLIAGLVEPGAMPSVSAIIMGSRPKPECHLVRLFGANLDSVDHTLNDWRMSGDINAVCGRVWWVLPLFLTNHVRVDVAIFARSLKAVANVRSAWPHIDKQFTWVRCWTLGDFSLSLIKHENIDEGLCLPTFHQ